MAVMAPAGANRTFESNRPGTGLVGLKSGSGRSREWSRHPSRGVRPCLASIARDAITHGQHVGALVAAA